MRFEVRNRAGIANKYIRFAKWKIRKHCSRFGDVLYAELYVSETGSRLKTYNVVIKLGVPGPDIIIKSEHTDLGQLWASFSAKIKRQLRKQGERR
jgi:ribosome-associated translation inhibitor RaiA